MTSASTAGSSRCRLLLGLMIWISSWTGLAQEFTVPTFRPDPEPLKRLTRTRSLLSSARADHHPELRIMVYGQSHSLGEWSNYLAANLQRMYPHARIVITNKAIAGFSALLLSRSVNADVIPWQPDLLLLHCMGDNLVDYHRLYTIIKTQTTADVLVHADHVQSNGQLNESLDISDVGPDTYWVLRNYHWLPELVNQYGFCWADIRTPWKEYIFENGIPYKSLLAADGYHCNDSGFRLTANLLTEFFKPNPDVGTVDPMDTPRVRTVPTTSLGGVTGREKTLRVKGNRVDLIYDPTTAGQAEPGQFTLDGKRPQEVESLYSFDRATPAWATPWPGILAATHAALPVEERWTISTDSISLNTGQVFFSVEGSVTGKDGSGSNFGVPFVSNSRRLSIVPEAFMQHLAYVLTLQVPPADWKITVDCVLRAAKTFRPRPPTEPGRESVETLYLSDKEGEHELKLISQGSSLTGVKAIRVYSPSGQASIENLSAADPWKLSAVLAQGVLRINWPASAGQGQLKSMSAINGDSNWLPVDQKVVLRDGVYECLIPIDSAGQSTRFFRWFP